MCVVVHSQRSCSGKPTSVKPIMKCTIPNLTVGSVLNSLVRGDKDGKEFKIKVAWFCNTLYKIQEEKKRKINKNNLKKLTNIIRELLLGNFKHSGFYYSKGINRQ